MLSLSTMSDSTLILRGRPKDPTPGWVGDPATEATDARQPEARQPPPWLAPTAAAPVAIADDQTMMLRGGALRPVALRLLAYTPDLGLQLATPTAMKPAGRRPRAQEEARTISDALAATPPRGGAELAELVEAALSRGGAYHPPLEVVAGELVFEVDAIAQLRATLPVLLPLAAVSPDAAAAVATAKALLAKAPVDPRAAVAATEALWSVADGDDAEKLRQKEQVMRGLLVRRALAKGHLFGLELFRASLLLEGAQAVLEVYLAPSLLEKVALAPRIRCRAFALLGVATDRGEPEPIAAKLVALAEVTQPAR